MNWKQTYKGRISWMYTSMNSRVRLRPAYQGFELLPRVEFERWIEANKAEYRNLYDAWLESGFERDLCPTVDRIDPHKGYTADNIRLATWYENVVTGPRRKTRHVFNPTGYKGVRKVRDDKYETYMKLDGKRTFLGCATSPELAARLYDDKAYELYGDNAVLNFPRQEETECCSYEDNQGSCHKPRTEAPEECQCGNPTAFGSHSVYGQCIPYSPITSEEKEV